ncbi:hypothetical protein [Vibrio lentus]|uniref:hypothetical protein n=1 Tax=Vibrio lentus TaxID=136468 RepID=UPI0009763753|nr:hypothetical protein [Vibrio lentus]OMO21236.1 hypothetical protein BH583_10850 [Vibrio lentus]PMN15148.1 hypothetical protein BCT38_00370 [Vibrio lentus]
MTDLELYSQINETINILVWPSAILVVLFTFKKMIATLLSRAAGLEGKVGDVSFKLSLQQMMQEEVSEAVQLKADGKEEEAESLIKSSSEIISSLYGLSQEDVDELVSLSKGEDPRRHWGKAHLVRAGLVDFKGGTLTNNGKILVKKYLRQDH